jgi:hypothetical protein
MATRNIHYNLKLACYFKDQVLFFDGELQKKTNVRKCMEQPWQQTKAESWDDVTETLCTLDFINAKCRIKSTNDLLNDFSSILQKIPDNKQSFSKIEEHNKGISKYIYDLNVYSKGYTKLPQIPRSISQKQNKNLGLLNFKENNRLGKIKEFYGFVNTEVFFLNKHFDKDNYTFQHAFNYNHGGFIEHSCIADLHKVNKPLILLDPAFKVKSETTTHFIRKIDAKADSDIKINLECTIALSKNTKEMWDLSSSRYLKYEYDFHFFSNDFKKAIFRKIGEESTKNLLPNSEDKLVILDIFNNKEIASIISGNYYPSADLNTVYYVSYEKSFSSSSLNSWDVENNKIHHIGEYLGGTSKITSSFNNSVVIVISNNILTLNEEKEDEIKNKLKSIHEKMLELIKEHKTNSSEYIYLGQQKNIINGQYSEWHVNIWETSHFNLLHHSVYNKPISELHISNDGKKCLILLIDEIIIKMVDNWETIGKFDFRGKQITNICFSFDWEYAFWIEDNINIKTYDFNKRDIIKSYNSDVKIINILVTHDGRTMFVVHEKTENVRANFDTSIVNVFNDTIIKKIENIQITDISIDGMLGICSEGLIDIELYLPLPDISNSDSMLNVNSLDPSGKTAISATDNGNLNYIDFKDLNKTVIKEITKYKRPIYFISWLWNSDLVLLSSDDESIYLFSALNKTVLGSYIGSRYPDYTTCLKSSCCFASFLEDRFSIRTIHDGTILYCFAPVEMSEILKFGPDERMIFSLNGDCIIGFDFRDESSIIYFEKYTTIIEDFDLDPSGLVIASIAKNNKIQIWSVIEKRLIRQIDLFEVKKDFSNYRGTGNKILFLPDGSHILVAGYDNSIQIWNIETNQLLSYLSESSPIGSFSNIVNGLEFISGLKQMKKYKITNLKLNFIITTLIKFWNYECNEYEKYYKYYCPNCGEIIFASLSVIESIRRIEKKYGFNSENSNYLNLPKDAWDEPGLVSICSNCQAKIKFNPFLVDNSNIFIN